MRINIKHLNLRSRDTLDHWVEEEILALGEARQIDEANIQLECRDGSSPPFRVHIHLVTPGPDLCAESCDHTLRAAFLKVVAQLRGSISMQAQKQLRRQKSNSAAPPAKARSGGWR